MASQIAALADAVAASLNAGDWSIPIAATRLWRVNWALEDLGTLKVAVVPGPVSWIPTDRKIELKRLTTDIVFAKKINPDTVAEVDAVMDVVEEIAEAFFEQMRTVTSASKQFRCISRGEGNQKDPGRQIVSPEDALVDERLLSNNRAAVFVLRLGWTQVTP